MGASGSTESSGPHGSLPNLYDFLQGSSKGLHIHSLEPSSPASLSGLQTFFDFITHVNGERVESIQDWATMLQEIARNSKGSPAPLFLIVYSSKTVTVRNVTVIPTLQPSQSSGTISTLYIGAGIKECDFSNAHERVWHVLEVITGSPAALAGLVEQSDYIIGSRDAEGGEGLVSKNDFGALVSLFEKRQLHLWVYSTTLDTIREVVLVPDSNWGGDGMLGCDIGFGHVHRIALVFQEKNISDQKQLNIQESLSGSVAFKRHSSFPAGGNHHHHNHSHQSNGHHHEHTHDHSHQYDHRELKTRTHEDHVDHSYSCESGTLESHDHSYPCESGTLEAHDHSYPCESGTLEAHDHSYPCESGTLEAHEPSKTKKEESTQAIMTATTTISDDNPSKEHDASITIMTTLPLSSKIKPTIRPVVVQAALDPVK